MQKDNLVLAGILLIAILGFAFLLLATPEGIGISLDSASYISAARNILNGQGLSVSFDLTPDGHQLQSWIKERRGYPVLLAAIGALGPDPLVAARWLNAVLFAANIFLAGFIVLRQPCGRLWLLPITASLLIMTATDSMVLVHSMAWSEPPFVFFGFLGIYLLAGYLDKGGAWRLIFSAITFLLALTTRFAGAAFIAAGIFALVVMGHRNLRRRVVDAAIFLVISGAPLLLWIYKNTDHIGKEFSFNRFTPRHFKIICKALGQWLPLGLASRILAGILLIAACAVIVFGLMRILRKRSHDGAHAHLSSSLPGLLAAFIFFYLCLYVAVVLFVSSETGLDTRLYAPMFVAVLILAMCMSGPFLDATIGNERFRKKALVALCAIFVICYSLRSVRWFLNVRKDGQGLASRAFQQSEVLRLTKELPAHTLIFSNLPEAIYIVTGRSSYLTPRRNLCGSTVVRSRVDSELDCMGEYMLQNKAKLVFIKGMEQPYLVPLEAMIDRFHLRLVNLTHDGAIYELPD